MTQATLLHVVNEFSNASSNRLIFNLVKGLDRDKYDVHIGCTKDISGAMVAQFECAGAKVVNFGSTGYLNSKVIPQMVRYIRANNIQIIHTHVLRSDLLGGLAARFARHRVLFSTKHNMGNIRGQRGWLLRNLFYWPIFYLPDQVITVTDVLRRQMIARLRLSPDRVTTIYNAINSEDYFRPAASFACRESMGISPEDYVVTYTGRLVEGKGLDYLLHAAQQLLLHKQNAYFLIVGDGPLRTSLKSLAQELGIASHVIFTGFRSDIPEILAATDIYVLPSLTEALPLSLLEAMAAGKAVIATPVGGVVELVEPNVTGILVPQRNPKVLTEAVCRLLDDRREREEMGFKARSYARRNFSIDSMVNAYDALYQRHLVRRHNPASRSTLTTL